MASLGTEMSLAFCTAVASDGLISGSEVPDSLAEDSISRMALPNSLPRLASWRCLRCLVLAHLL